MGRSSRLKTAAKSSEANETTKTVKPTLQPSVPNPPKLFVLPKNVSKDARVVTLPNPATSTANRYYHCPENGIYEFIKVAAPRSASRSLLFTSQKVQSSKAEEKTISLTEDVQSSHICNPQDAFFKSYITRSADMFIATPVDLLFFLLPILSPLSIKDQKQMFLTLDDHLDAAPDVLKRTFQTPSTRILLEKRLATICDTVEAGDDTMFRLSTEKLAKEMLKKANTVVRKGLPPSVEERFIKHALQFPVLSVEREESAISIVDLSSKSKGALKPSSQIPLLVHDESAQVLTPSATAGTSQNPSLQSQPSDASSITSVAVEDAANNFQETEQAPENVVHLLRIRTALEFMASSYLPQHLRSRIELSLTANKLVDFTPVEEHMKHLNALREQARALRSLSDNISRKRGLEDDEAVEAREEKKRKKEEEEKKKKTASRALKSLKKVDTSGMMKMSSFFIKAPKK